MRKKYEFIHIRTLFRRAFLIMLLLAVISPAIAQQVEKYSISTQMFLDEQAGRITFEKPVDFAKGTKANGITTEQVMRYGKYDRPIAKAVEKDGVKFISAFIRVSDRSVVPQLEALGVEIECEFLDGTLYTTLIPVDKIAEVSELAKVTHINVATKKRPLTNMGRQYSNVDDVLSYSTDARNAGLPNAYDGSGVLLGVIDTGIDFQHKAFKDASGNFRIKRAYVYTGSGSAKEYGDGASNALSSSAPTTDDSSEDHGTHTSSIAGGSSVIINGSTTTVTTDHANASYGGMAPGADLYLAGCDLSDTYLANSFQKIVNYADSKGVPVVVSNSWGSQVGPHDGTGDFADICAQYFSDSNPNHICLFAASNDAGTNGFHVSGTSTSSSPVGTVLNYNTDYGLTYYYGILANAWSRSNVTLRCKVIVINSSGTVQTTVDVNPTSGSYSQVSLGSTYVSSGSLVAYRDYVSINGKSQIMLYASSLKMRSGYKLAVQFYPSSGSSVVDIWSGAAYTYFTSTPSSSGYTWTAGSDNMCVSDEATIPSAISIGAYSTKRVVQDYNGTNHTMSDFTVGDIAYFSSWATAAASPTGLSYPWICAPGATMVSAVNAYDTSGSMSYINGNCTSYDMYRVNSDTTNPYGSMEGTSMATPAAAGIVALWLQVAKDNNIELTTSDIKTIMKETAITDSYTNGTNASHFGNGKIDALAGIKYILDNYVQNDNPTITAAPTAVAFGDQVAGGTYTQTFTVTGANLEGNITLAKSGSSAFTISQTSVTKATAEGNGATITVTFKPTAGTTADYTGTVTLTSSNATTVTVALTGKGVYTAPAITANPTSLSFTGNSGSTYTKTVTVTGSNLQGNITAAISGDANGFYSVSPTTITASNGSASRTLTVTWTPTAGGTSTANLVLTTTGTGAGSVTVPITGTAQGPTITANPTSVTFSNAYATRTYTQTVAVTGTNLSQNITASLSGAQVYSIDKTSLTATGGNIIVTYAPTAAGTTNATLTLSSTGASSVTVPITGTAQAATPALVVSPTTLTFSTDLENSQQQTFAVTGRFIGETVNVTLTDANGVFTVSPTSIPAANISEDTPVNITVTFQSANAGSYNGTITLTSNGAESKTVTLNATANDGGTASDAYLDIAKYATIDEAGWRTALVNNLYKYTEYTENGIAWLTLPAYGAFVGARYSTTSSTVGSGRPQAWIECSLGTNNTYGGTTWTNTASYTNPFNGSSAYFTSATARAIGYNSRTNTEVRTISYYVTNTTAVKLSGTGRNGTNTTYPASLKVYECTKNGDNLTPSTTAIKNLTNSSTTTFTLTAEDLDETKIYKVETSIYRGYMYEIAFQTPLNKPSLSVTPAELSIKAAPGETATATFNVKGRLLTDNVTVTLNDQNGVFAVNPTSISISDAQAGSDVTVSFSSETEGTFTGTVTVASGDLVETVALIGVSADGGTASDNYLNIAKYATIDQAGATVSGMSSIYKYTEYADQACAWLTLSNNGAMQADANQNWLATTSLTRYNNSWDASDIFPGDDAYYGSNQAYSIYGSGNQTFYVTNCTQVKSLIKGGSANATLAIYECTEGTDGILTAATTATDTKTGNCSSSSPAVITSATIDASKIYKVVLTGGGSYPDLLEIAFQTPLNTPTLTASPTGIDFIAEPGQTITETITVTGARLTEDVAVTLTDANGVYELDKSSISIAEATGGATVTVTFNAPEQMGSYRGQVTFTSGTATAKTVFYGAVGEKGSAYSNYLDIAKYSTIGTGNWYDGVFANPYKFTEYEADDCAWLTLPAAMPFYAWNYNDQNWCGVSSSASGGWYGHQWTATDVFQGHEFFKGTFEDETDTYAHMMGPNVSSDAISTSTTMFYGVYQVTNCTQVKALCYNNGTATNYPAFIQIYEMTENADGTLTRSENSTDVQNGTTSGSQITMTSAELDASKIYFVAVGGYRGFTYEVAFRTPLPAEMTLAQVVDDAAENKYYRIVDGDLEVVKISADGKKIFCKDANAYANPSEIAAGQVDYIKELANLPGPATWDQSNWVALQLDGTNWTTNDFPAVGSILNGVRGTLIDVANPVLLISGDAKPTVAKVLTESYASNPNTFITCNFYGTQVGNNGTEYFFVEPKPMEIAKVAWAMWNEASQSFIVPTSVGSSNVYALSGGFYINSSEYNGSLPELVDGGIYTFLALVKNESAASSKLMANNRDGAQQAKVVYPLEGLDVPIGQIDGEGVITYVNDVRYATQPVEIGRYNVQGMRVDSNYRGVVIVVMSDGTAHKVVQD